MPPMKDVVDQCEGRGCGSGAAVVDGEIVDVVLKFKN